MSGTVYILTNKAMPGLVKIGRTTADDPQVRMDQLYNTSVPVPFNCVLAVRVGDPAKVERNLHKTFGPNRFNPGREFFEIETEQAVAALSLVEGEDVTPNVNETNNSIPEEERSSPKRLQGMRKRRPNLNFQEMGIPPGSVLHPTLGEETATVIDHRKVRFRDQEMSITEATKLRENLSYSAAPSRFWLYEGRNLSDIYEETYPQDEA